MPLGGRPALPGTNCLIRAAPRPAALLAIYTYIYIYIYMLRWLLWVCRFVCFLYFV